MLNNFENSDLRTKIKKSEKKYKKWGIKSRDRIAKIIKDIIDKIQKEEEIEDIMNIFYDCIIRGEDTSCLGSIDDVQWGKLAIDNSNTIDESLRKKNTVVNDKFKNKFNERLIDKKNELDNLGYNIIKGNLNTLNSIINNVSPETVRQSIRRVGDDDNRIKRLQEKLNKNPTFTKNQEIIDLTARAIKEINNKLKEVYIIKNGEKTYNKMKNGKSDENQKKAREEFFSNYKLGKKLPTTKKAINDLISTINDKEFVDKLKNDYKKIEILKIVEKQKTPEVKGADGKIQQITKRLEDFNIANQDINSLITLVREYGYLYHNFQKQIGGSNTTSKPNFLAVIRKSLPKTP